MPIRRARMCADIGMMQVREWPDGPHHDPDQSGSDFRKEDMPLEPVCTGSGKYRILVPLRQCGPGKGDKQPKNVRHLSIRPLDGVGLLGRNWLISIDSNGGNCDFGIGNPELVLYSTKRPEQFM